jgi:hypothetical protein
MLRFILAFAILLAGLAIMLANIDDCEGERITNFWLGFGAFACGAIGMFLAL